MLEVREIGVVHSRFSESSDPHKMKEFESTIEIHPEFEEGLYRIEESEYLDILFYFNQSKGYHLIVDKTYYGEKKGVFACKTPNRPSGIGLIKVKLIERIGNRLIVKGLDALDQTPVIDIKPYSGDLSDAEQAKLKSDQQKRYPRGNLIPLIKNNKLEELLTAAGTLHGHYCPGLATGVMASVAACNKLREFSDGMEDIIASIEINSCFADGIQYVAGCTLGNNSLVYKDMGKTAVTFALRNGKGIRYSQKQGFRDLLNRQFPEFSKLFTEVVSRQNREEELLGEFKRKALEASFGMLQWDIDQVFDIKEVTTKLPDYAPIRNSVLCTECGENIMKEKEVPVDNQTLCITCSHSDYFQLDGRGIVPGEL